jgi:hypothetical protein
VHPRLAEISNFLESCRAGVYTAIANASETRLEQSPADGGWSPAQVVEHLALAESKTSQYLVACLDKAIAAGLPHEQDATSVLDTFDPAVLASGRLTAPEIVTPAAPVSSALALHALHASHEALQATLRSADGWALAEVPTRHPLLGRMNMYQSLVVVGYHDRRHAHQITRALATPA